MVISVSDVPKHVEKEELLRLTLDTRVPFPTSATKTNHPELSSTFELLPRW
jgi:hypothetical protein